jgi:hypothetical protein
MHDGLQNGVRELRSALRSAAAQLDRGRRSGPAVQDLGSAVDGLRGSIWGILQDAHADDSRVYQAEIRVARANEICRAVLDHLHSGTIRPDLQGFELLRASMRELQAMASREWS